MYRHSMSASAALVLSFILGAVSHAEAPAGYYRSCEGKSGRALLVALRDVISDHHNVGYDGLWSVYRTSDVRPNGKIWDMYSTVEFSYGTKQCGNYKNVGDCYNREHSFPKSWFKEASPMKSDAFHVYPTDGKVNGQRSNHPYGECEGGTSAGAKALGRLGRSTFPGYSGTVFEPDDEYKGDFARTYFYMAACYNDRISGWSSPMLAGNNYPCYTTWAVNLLLKWHRQDTVSKKETDRNDAVYSYQDNRNPFIDHPELVEYIWGDKQTVGWTPGGEVTPMITLPVDGTVIDFGVTAVNVARTRDVVVKGTGLKDDVTVSVAGTGFTVSERTLPVSDVCSAEGATLRVSYLVATASSTIGSVVLSSGECRSTLTLRAEAVDGLPVEKASDVADDGFTIRWGNIGDGSRYTVSVYRDGRMLDGYPVQVDAAVESHRVSGLDAETEYTYTVSSNSLVSERMSVITTAPMPDIQFGSIAGMTMASRPGECSEPVEVTLLVENIYDDITVSVGKPFELSTDKSGWSQSVVITPDEERVYLRLGACDAGTYTGSLTASVGDYDAESEDFTGRCAATVSFKEDFEATATTVVAPYKTGVTYSGTACAWLLMDAGIASRSGDLRNGAQSVCLGKNADSSIAMAEDKAGGIGTVTFYAAPYNGKDAEAVIVVEYSADGGKTWKSAGVPVTVKGTTLTRYSVAVNRADATRVRLQQQSGKRVNIDDVTISDYSASSGVDDVEGIAGWDAYCRGGRLVVETREAVPVSVYATDASLRYAATVDREAVVDLAPGVYVVVVGEGSRRVVVK